MTNSQSLLFKSNNALQEAKEKAAQLLPLCLMDDDFARYVFNSVHGIPIIQELVDRLPFKKSRIIKCSAQDHQINLPYEDAREGILDIHAAAEDGTEFTIELENKTDANSTSFGRLMFYSASIVVQSIPSNTAFDEVPNVCAIIILRKDILGEGKSCYPIELATPINGVWKPIKDYPAIHQTFSYFLINLEVRDDTPISCFIQDFLEPDPGQMTNEVLKKEIGHIKKEGGKEMIETYSAKFQEDLNQAHQQGYQQGFQLGSQDEKSSRIRKYICLAKKKHLSDSEILKNAEDWDYTEDEVKQALKSYATDLS